MPCVRARAPQERKREVVAAALEEGGEGADRANKLTIEVRTARWAACLVCGWTTHARKTSLTLTGTHVAHLHALLALLARARAGPTLPFPGHPSHRRRSRPGRATPSAPHVGRAQYRSTSGCCHQRVHNAARVRASVGACCAEAMIGWRAMVAANRGL